VTRQSEDRELLEAVESGFATVGGLIEQTRFKAAIHATVDGSGEQVRERPGAVETLEGRPVPRRDGSIRGAAVIDNLKVLFSPFLPFSSQRLHELLGYDGWLGGPLEFREVTEPQGSGRGVRSFGDLVADPCRVSDGCWASAGRTQAVTKESAV
jgi:methionyl-tRNA synthetase